MHRLPFEADDPPATDRVADGAVRLPGWLPTDLQVALVGECRELIEAAGYVPKVRGGGQMHVRMVCLGRHWNPLTYRYEAIRSDYDGRAVPPLSPGWRDLAIRIASDAGFPFAPDICLINFYDSASRMGMHQDKDESPASIAGGAPVVSLSLGDTARFLFGGLKRRDPVQSILLESGDAFVFGEPARLRYHGVSRILPRTAPDALQFDGRFNLTFRQF